MKKYIFWVLVFFFSGGVGVSQTLKAEDQSSPEELLFKDIPQVVTAAKKEQTVDDAPASVTVISAKDLKNRGITSISQALKTVVGTYVSVSERHLKRIHVRGVGNAESTYNDKVLLLIDGVPHKDLFYGHAFIDEFLPIKNIKRIEVIRGPGSALYGTNAFAGVINIITKEASDIEGTEVYGGLGNNETTSAGVLSSQKVGSGDISIFSRMYETQGDGPLYSQDAERNSLQSDPVKSYNFWLNYSLENFTLNAKYIEYSHKFHSDWDLPSYIWERNWFNYKNTFVDMEYEKDIADPVELTGKAWWHDYDNTSFWQVANDSGTVDADVYPVKKSYTLGGSVELDADLPLDNNVIAGTEMNYEEIEQVEDIEINRFTGEETDDYTDFWMPSKIHRNYSFYLQNIWNTYDSVAITLGVRDDVHEVYGSFFSPRGSVVIQPADKLNFKLMYGEAFRAPSFREMYTETEDFTEANKDLDREEIKTSEVEVDYSFTENLTVKGNYYQNRIKNLIIQEDDKWINSSDKSIINGVEGRVNYSLNKLDLQANYSYIDARYEEDDEKFDYIPSNMANAIIEYRFDSGVNLNTTVNWVDDRPRGDEIINEYYRAGSSVDQYTTVDFSLNYKLKKLDITASVKNLLDEKYFDPHEDTSKMDIERAGRTYMVETSVAF
ncbi:MAG: TonB-dependent receptor plug domain-containing protein [Elusimicrobiota bacterium]